MPPSHATHVCTQLGARSSRCHQGSANQACSPASGPTFLAAVLIRRLPIRSAMLAQAQAKGDPAASQSQVSHPTPQGTSPVFYGRAEHRFLLDLYFVSEHRAYGALCSQELHRASSIQTSSTFPHSSNARGRVPPDCQKVNTACKGRCGYAQEDIHRCSCTPRDIYESSHTAQIEIVGLPTACRLPLVCA